MSYQHTPYSKSAILAVWGSHSSGELAANEAAGNNKSIHSYERLPSQPQTLNDNVPITVSEHERAQPMNTHEAIKASV